MIERPQPVRPVVTIADVATAVHQVEETLSEVLVLLYHVIHAHQDVIDSLRVSAPRPPRPTVSV
jgi:hypothetical protein